MLLAQSEDRHRRLMRVIPDAVIIVDDGVFTFGNDAAVAMCGVASEDELVGMPMSRFQTPDVVADSMVFGRRFRETGVTDGPLVAWMHRIDGTPVRVEVTPATVPGNDRSLLLVMRDVTEHDRRTRRTRRIGSNRSIPDRELDRHPLAGERGPSDRLWFACHACHSRPPPRGSRRHRHPRHDRGRGSRTLRRSARTGAGRRRSGAGGGSGHDGDRGRFRVGGGLRAHRRGDQRR